jgi:hypothetical protein
MDDNQTQKGGFKKVAAKAALGVATGGLSIEAAAVKSSGEYLLQKQQAKKQRYQTFDQTPDELDFLRKKKFKDLALQRALETGEPGQDEEAKANEAQQINQQKQQEAAQFLRESKNLAASLAKGSIVGTVSSAIKLGSAIGEKLGESLFYDIIALCLAIFKDVFDVVSKFTGDIAGISSRLVGIGLILMIVMIGWGKGNMASRWIKRRVILWIIELSNPVDIMPVATVGMILLIIQERREAKQERAQDDIVDIDQKVQPELETQA